jgi:hypothetical protein
MYRPRRRFTRLSWLDGIVYRFQHRWETNPQFRAAATGAIGLIVVIGMCACMGISGLVANSVLAGGGGAGVLNLDTGTSKLAAPTAFPTDTVPPYAVGNVPAVSPIPDSQTPAPGPTATVTTEPATPTDTAGGGPGPGGLPTTCNGGSHGGSWSFTPCPVIHGQSVTLNVSAPGHGGASMYVVVQFNASNCTWLLYPTLSGSGTWSVTDVVPACGANATVPLGGEINITGAYVMLMDAAPVQ